MKTKKCKAKNEIFGSKKNSIKIGSVSKFYFSEITAEIRFIFVVFYDYFSKLFF